MRSKAATIRIRHSPAGPVRTFGIELRAVAIGSVMLSRPRRRATTQTVIFVGASRLIPALGCAALAKGDAVMPEPASGHEDDGDAQLGDDRRHPDRKSGVEGKGGSVRVDLG